MGQCPRPQPAGCGQRERACAAVDPGHSCSLHRLPLSARLPASHMRPATNSLLCAPCATPALCCVCSPARRQMLMAAKVPSCASLALDAVNKEGMCVVIGLQSTGEANTAAVREQVAAGEQTLVLSCLGLCAVCWAVGLSCVSCCDDHPGHPFCPSSPCGHRRLASAAADPVSGGMYLHLLPQPG